MNLSIETIKFEKTQDRQKHLVYSLDSELSLLIKQKKITPRIIFKDIKNELDIIEFTKKILEDFAISTYESKILKSKITQISYVQFNTINYAPQHTKGNFIETVIHEITHVLSVSHFNYNSDAVHDGFFVALFKKVLEHYNIINHSEWKIASFLSSNHKTEIYNDSDISINMITKKEAELLIDLNYTKTNKKDLTIYEYKNNESNTLNIIRIDHLTDKATHTTRKLMPYERTINLFSQWTAEELVNFTLLSQPYTCRTEGIIGVTVLNIDISDTRGYIKAYRHFEACWAKNESVSYIKEEISKIKLINKNYCDF